MLLAVLTALAQEAPPPQEGAAPPVADRPEDLAEGLPVVPVSEGMFAVVVRVQDVLPVVVVGGLEVPLADGGEGADAVAGDGVFSGEVPAPGSGTITVLVEGEEAFSDQVPLNAGERVRVVMSERGPTLSFEPAEHTAPVPDEHHIQSGELHPPPPEGQSSGSLGQVALAAGAALAFGVLLGGWLGPNILGRRSRPGDASRAGLELDGRTLWTCEDRPAVEALLCASGQTLLVRGELGADEVLDAAEDASGALVLVRLEELADGGLAEVLKDAPSNLVLLAEGEHPQASGTLRVLGGRLEAV
jgi:hypothetical protein